MLERGLGESPKLRFTQRKGDLKEILLTEIGVEQKVQLNAKIGVIVVEVSHHFFVLPNFLEKLKRQLGSNSFLAIVDACRIFGQLKRQEPEYANLAENAWRAYNGALCGISKLFKFLLFSCS
ncbi:hypothetical protein AVEN_218373-1 [Araneus ventricosus]|uniref:Uncharacterized protein n=1 Tax=Araneus ventricosus TaxID=182803 RepID=A0A4Y2PP94_ARAVE|nr:hypothetical protein AVEN_218373-1 [Araneus ventricosus]